MGLLPKDSLICYVAAVLLILTTANLLCGILSGIGFSLISTSLDPWSHKIGQYLLLHEHLEPTWTWLATLPVMPWTRFNNTVVLGTLVIGLLALVPLYYISYYLFDSFGKLIAKRIAENPLIGWLVATPAAGP